MKYYSDIFSINIVGPKEGVVRMLNAAIRNVGTGNVVTEDDNIETINEKVKEDDGGYGLRISILDLMDEQCLKDSIILEKKLAFDKKREYHKAVLAGEVKFDSEEDEEYAYWKAQEESEGMCDGRFIDILKVLEVDGVYEVKMEFYIGEDSISSPDWAGWDDVCRLYGCKVVVDDVEFLNGGFLRFCGTTICEMEEGKLKKTRIEPKLDIYGYIYAFKELCKMAPEHYRQIKIQDMEAKVRALQTEISREKLSILLEQLDDTQGHLDVPEGVTYLSDVMWPYKDKFRSIYIPASVDTINKYAISSSNLESIEISPDNPNFCSVNNCILDKDKTRLLIGCKGSIVPEGIIEIENSAFSGCRGLEKITIPSHIKKVGNHTFCDCTELVELVIEDGVESLGWASFSGCTALTSVVIPDSLTNLPTQLFEGCTSLTDVTLPKHLEEKADDAFKNTPWGGFEEVPAKTANEDDLPF